MDAMVSAAFMGGGAPGLEGEPLLLNIYDNMYHQDDNITTNVFTDEQTAMFNEAFSNMNSSVYDMPPSVVPVSPNADGSGGDFGVCTSAIYWVGLTSNIAN